MDKTELLAAIRAERTALEQTLARLSPERITESHGEGAWSVKDVLAHIVAWERWMSGWIEQLLRGEMPHDPAPVETTDDIDQLNASNYERNRGRALDDVLADFRQSYANALSLVESLSEETLQEEHPDTWPHGSLWHGVAANTCWHYREHLEAIDAVMDDGAPDGTGSQGASL